MQQPTPRPVKPDTVQLDGQITTLKTNVKTLQDQIVQSESNLTAQWTVLQQQQRATVDETITKAREAQLEEQSRSCGLKLPELENVLQPIVETCTKESISAGKSWIFQHGTNFNSNQLICDYLVLKATKESAPFSQKLHLIYLINDALHHSVRKNADSLKAALEGAAVPMYCAAADGASEDNMAKLTKLMSLWESKNKFFSDERMEDMKNPGRTMKSFRSKLNEEFSEHVDPKENTATTTYNNYKKQHEQFVDHANNSVEQQQKQLEGLQQQLAVIMAKHESEMKVWLVANPGQAPPPAATTGRRSRWDRTAATEGGAGARALPDTSRPPPPNLPLAAPKVPTNPYFELPAGLMVPLVRMEDSGYRPIDPSLIRLPPPQPPNERLLAAVELFYSPPSHERPRDPEGWERLGLYEWARDKAETVQRKKEDIAAGRRAASPPPSPGGGDRPDTPEQLVPEEPRRRKKYRSRSSSREREKTRSRSGSRASTPDGAAAGERQRRESERSTGRRSPSPSSPEAAPLPSFLTRRSPSPPPGGQLGTGNKGHQMLQKMGWKGAGLGTSETGITEPVSGGEVRDKQDQYKGMGVGQDQYENFRRQKAGGYYQRVKDYMAGQS